MDVTYLRELNYLGKVSPVGVTRTRNRGVYVNLTPVPR